VIYYFGIKQGIGAESLSEFFKAMRMNRHVACSFSTLRKMKKKMREAIVAYESAQAKQCQPSEEHGICVGGDETFFGLPILVMMELRAWLHFHALSKARIVPIQAGKSRFKRGGPKRDGTAISWLVMELHR